MRPTLPRRGPPARSTTFWLVSIFTRSGWAAWRPARLSGTMSSTPLMSFFTRAGAVVAMEFLLVGGVWAYLCVRGSRPTDGLRGHGRRRHLAPDELVQERAEHAADRRAEDVDDDQLVDRDRGCADRLAEDGGTELAGRVERGAGDRADEDDDPVDDEADDQPGEAGRSLPGNRGSEDREHQDRGPDDLGCEPDGESGVSVHRHGAEAQLRGVVALQDDQRQCRADEGADELGDDVAAGRPGIDLAGREQ